MLLELASRSSAASTTSTADGEINHQGARKWVQISFTAIQAAPDSHFSTLDIGDTVADNASGSGDGSGVMINSSFSHLDDVYPGEWSRG